MGARGINNLASKILMTLFPPNTPCVRYRVDEYTAEALKQQEKVQADVEAKLAQRERAIMVEMETQALRPFLFEAIKHEIATGNTMLYLLPDGGLRVFRLDRYVVKRDPAGNVLEHITKEDIDPVVLEAMFGSAVYKKIRETYETEGAPKNDYKTCSLYTHVQRTPKKWTVYQEVHGLEVPGSRGGYPLDLSPWFPLRWIAIDGEDYGRGYVEEYLGGFQSLEGLRKAIVEGSAAAAKIVGLVNPGGVTRKKDLNDARNGDFISGKETDVTFLHVDKANDLQVAKAEADTLITELSRAFLLMSGVQRDAERVTAEEIRLLAQELESALGGVYSVQANVFQLPLVRRLEYQMEKSRKIPALPKEVIKLTPVGGLEALGRGHDLNKLDMFLGGAQQVLGPEVTAKYTNVSEYLTRRATAIGIDPKGLVPTQDEVLAQERVAMQQQMLQSLGPDAIKAISDNVIAARQQQGATPAQAAPPSA
jgi:hypothetical protein